MKKWTRMLVLALSAVTVLALSACGGANTTPTATNGTLRVGMECNYPPFNWTQTEASDSSVPIEGGGYADGYDVQIAKKIAAGLNKDLVIVKTEWDGLIPALTSGKIDAIIAGMSPTAERKVTIDFSDAYYTSELVVVVKKDSAYANATALSDFSGAKITGQLNTFHYSVIDQIPNVKKQTAMKSFPAMTVALTSGKIDGYVAERPHAVAVQLAHSDLSFVSFAEGKGFTASEEDVAIAVGLKKGSDLTEKINEVLKGISAEDRQAIMDQAAKDQPLSEEE